MANVRPMRAAILGSGRISKVYIETIKKYFSCLELAAGWDKKPERAKENEALFGVEALSLEEILSDRSIEVILNLTQPLDHYEITKKALLAGKHVYSEKMIAGSMEEATELVSLAKTKGLAFTMAPDTFLGGGWQTARKLIDDGYIGKPLFVNASCERSYQLTDREPKIKFSMNKGGGIPYDMGGYYLHAMFLLFGSLTRVSGFMEVQNVERCFQNPRNPMYREEVTIPPEAVNSMAAALEFACGVRGTLTMTSQTNLYYDSKFEVQGTEGILTLFDPNYFGDDILLRRNMFGHEREDSLGEPVKIPFTHGYTEETRGIGAADMVYALRNGRAPRADAAIGLHAFEAVEGLRLAQGHGNVYEMTTKIGRPAPLRQGIIRGEAQESILDD